VSGARITLDQSLITSKYRFQCAADRDYYSFGTATSGWLTQPKVKTDSANNIAGSQIHTSSLWRMAYPERIVICAGVNRWSGCILRHFVASENDRYRLVCVKCTRPLLEHKAPGHDGMRCALLLISRAALEGLSRIQAWRAAASNRIVDRSN
jgi:hypothetical protein